MTEFVFEPIGVNARAPGGERILRNFDDVGAFILMRVDPNFRKSPWWQAVRKELSQTRYGSGSPPGYAQSAGRPGLGREATEPRHR